jgi:predicted ATPase
VSVDGANTAPVLSSLKLLDDDRFESVQAALKRIVPSVERIRIRRTGGSAPGTVYEQIHFDLRGAADLPASVVSEGTLVVVALLTSICATSGRRLVLLDDIDRALHPAAQLELIRQMKRLLEEMPELQVVATTHSPFILDELDPSEVCVFALREDGSVATKRLSEHPDAGKVKGALSGGQIWTLDPEERWVAGETA